MSRRGRAAVKKRSDGSARRGSVSFDVSVFDSFTSDALLHEILAVEGQVAAQRVVEVQHGEARAAIGELGLAAGGAARELARKNLSRSLAISAVGGGGGGGGGGGTGTAIPVYMPLLSELPK